MYWLEENLPQLGYIGKVSRNNQVRNDQLILLFKYYLEFYLVWCIYTCVHALRFWQYQISWYTIIVVYYWLLHNLIIVQAHSLIWFHSPIGCMGAIKKPRHIVQEFLKQKYMYSNNVKIQDKSLVSICLIYIHVGDLFSLNVYSSHFVCWNAFLAMPRLWQKV